MSGLGLPENRPALARVASVPADWTTPSERLLLLALALDSFDGNTCAPGRDALMSFCGIRHVRTFQRLRDSLATATDARPALIEVDALSGRHTRYRLLPDSERLSGGDSESLSGPSNLSARPDSKPLSGDEMADLSARPDSTTCQHDLSARPDSDSLSYPSLPLPTHREGEREGGTLSAPAPVGAARPRLSVADVRDIVGYIVPATAMGNGVKCNNPDLVNALQAASERGWTIDALAASLSDMPAPKSSATGLLITRLKALADTDPASIATAAQTNEVAAAALDVDQSNDVQRCRHGVSRRLPEGSCSACVDHHDQLRWAFDVARRHGFTVNKGAKQDDGDRPYSLVAANTTIAVFIDEYDDPFDVVYVTARRPARPVLAWMHQLGDVRPQRDDVYTVDIDTEQESVPSLVADLAKSLAEIRLDTQPKETP